MHSCINLIAHDKPRQTTRTDCQGQHHPGTGSPGHCRRNQAPLFLAGRSILVSGPGTEKRPALPRLGNQRPRNPPEISFFDCLIICTRAYMIA